MASQKPPGSRDSSKPPRAEAIPKAPGSSARNVPVAPSAPPSMPPSSAAEIDDQDQILLKGIAGSPGVAVGPALVLGDIRSSYVRRHIHTAQIEAEITRVHVGVEHAKTAL